ncbi:MAG: hypothetical protein KDA93_21945 [Planctomycetaceae bacterium]|nr:hypothetical protein [Planctomycetaceae bacterium]
MFLQLAGLTLAMAAIWAVLLLPAYLVGGTVAIVGLSAASLVCLLPGVFVLLLHSISVTGRSPLAFLLMAIGLRMAIVLAAVLIAKRVWPGIPAAQFVGWLIPVYLVALAVETRFALTETVRTGRVPVGTARLHATPPQ